MIHGCYNPTPILRLDAAEVTIRAQGLETLNSDCCFDFFILGYKVIVLLHLLQEGNRPFPVKIQTCPQ